MLWSSSLHSIYIIDFTVPWEDAVEEAYEQKSLKYTELAADTKIHGWKAKVFPVEVVCRGFVGRSTSRLLRDMKIQGQAQRQPIQALFSEQASRWLWIKRKDTSWTPKQHPGKREQMGLHLGHQVLQMSPLKVLWAYHRNSGEGDCPSDDPRWSL